MPSHRTGYATTCNSTRPRSRPLTTPQNGFNRKTSSSQKGAILRLTALSMKCSRSLRLKKIGQCSISRGFLSHRLQTGALAISAKPHFRTSTPREGSCKCRALRSTSQSSRPTRRRGNASQSTLRSSILKSSKWSATQSPTRSRDTYPR